MKTNTPHNLRMKLESLRREIEASISLCDQVILEQDRQGQTTLAAQEDYREVEHYLIEVRQFKTCGDFDSYVRKVGAKVVTDLVFEWTGHRLTLPQIRKIAANTLTPPQIELQHGPN